MLVSETQRLKIRHYSIDDAEFILTLLNEPSFIENIADKGVRNKQDAIKFLQEGPILSYQKFGFGLNMVELKESGNAIGMCGLLKRDELEDVDIGYALLPEYTGKGYAEEAALGVLKNAQDEHLLRRVVAVTAIDNQGSIRLLEKTGFKFDKMIKFYGEYSQLFVIEC